MAELDERELLAIAHEAAEAAAAELRPRFGERAHGVRSKSTPTDLVSDADVAAEAAIRSVLSARRPGDSILGEEGGTSGGPAGAAGAAGGPEATGATGATGAAGEGAVRWIVDPLDGTINFLFGIPAFAVSVACENAAGTLAGVVLDPIREERFEATRSGGPMMNGERIQPSGRDDLATAMVATGFAYEASVRARQGRVVARLLPRVRDIRRVGAAALDLAWCACGRYDAYYERGLHPWDVAAGSLIARRAGLELRELPARDGEPDGVVVAPEAIMGELYELVASDA
jgi:myo-inositol-1(or 4)-monophosphatase